MNKVIQVWINCPDSKSVDDISVVLLDKKLVSSINVIEGLKSKYFWNEELCSTSEIALIAKTRENLFQKICDAVKIHHPYKIPSILALEVAQVDSDYAEWVSDTTVQNGE